MKTLKLPIQHFLLPFAIFVCIFALNACKFNSTEKRLNKLENELLWYETDSLLSILQQMDEPKGSDRHLYNLLRSMCRFRTQHNIESQNDITDAILYFERQQDDYHLALAFYLLGRVSTYDNNFGESMANFKKAEYYINKVKKHPHKNELAGIIYYSKSARYKRLGLDQTAQEELKEAMSYLDQTQLYTFLGVVYGDYGLSIEDKEKNREEFELYMNKSYEHYLKSGKQLWINQALYFNEKYSANPDTTKLIELDNIIIEKGDNNRAFLPAMYYISHHNLDSANYYINIFTASDYLEGTYYADKLYINACKEYEFGSKEKAFEMMTEIYHYLEGDFVRYIGNIFNISLQYEDLWFQELETKHKQKTNEMSILLFISLFVIFALIAVICVMFIFYKNKQQSMQQKEKELNAKIEEQNKLFRQQISEQIIGSQRIKDEVRREVVSPLAIMGIDNVIDSTKFISQFNKYFANYLSLLQQEHPTLTQNELAVIGLITLRYDANTCAILMNISKRTLWNKRQLIKQKLGLKKANLDNYLIRDCEKHISTNI